MRQNLNDQASLMTGSIIKIGNKNNKKDSGNVNSNQNDGGSQMDLKASITKLSARNNGKIESARNNKKKSTIDAKASAAAVEIPGERVRPQPPYVIVRKAEAVEGDGRAKKVDSELLTEHAFSRAFDDSSKSMHTTKTYNSV